MWRWSGGKKAEHARPQRGCPLALPTCPEGPLERRQAQEPWIAVLAPPTVGPWAHHTTRYTVGSHVNSAGVLKPLKAPERPDCFRSSQPGQLCSPGDFGQCLGTTPGGQRPGMLLNTGTAQAGPTGQNYPTQNVPVPRRRQPASQNSHTL